MDFSLDPGSPLPIYLQIAEELRKLIARGVLLPGEKVPTVREIAIRARVNRNTAARAIQELERLGLVRTRVGQGTFVMEETSGSGADRKDAMEAALRARIDAVIAEAEARGLPFEQLPLRLWQRIEAYRSRITPGSSRKVSRVPTGSGGEGNT